MSKKKRKKNKNKREKKMYTQNQNKINSTVVINSGPDYWETDVECISDCSKAPESIVVWVYPLAKEKIELLMDEYKNIEWLAYLIGKFGEKIEVSDIFVPNQEISTASVDNVICKEFNDLDIVGVIHSHHSMGNGFSKTDDDYINQNHNISLCISNSGINGHVRWETPCGSYKIVDCVVKIKTESLVDSETFIKEAKEKIKKKTYTTPVVHGLNNFHNVGGYYGGYPNARPGTWITKKNTIRKVPRHNEVFTPEETEEIEKEIESLDFSKEQTIEEEINLMKEMEEISTDFENQ